MKQISALIFLLGALAMIGGGVWVWLYIMTLVAKNYGPGFAVAALFLSMGAAKLYWHWLAAPWRAWLRLWADIDRRFD